MQDLIRILTSATAREGADKCDGGAELLGAFKRWGEELFDIVVAGGDVGGEDTEGAGVEHVRTNGLSLEAVCAVAMRRGVDCAVSGAIQLTEMLMGEKGLAASLLEIAVRHFFKSGLSAAVDPDSGKLKSTLANVLSVFLKTDVTAQVKLERTEHDKIKMQLDAEAALQRRQKKQKIGRQLSRQGSAAQVPVVLDPDAADPALEAGTKAEPTLRKDTPPEQIQMLVAPESDIEVRDFSMGEDQGLHVVACLSYQAVSGERAHTVRVWTVGEETDYTDLELLKCVPQPPPHKECRFKGRSHS
eukprot:SAG11_NODE_238_length_11818_cov_2.367693_2_plen_301_part_00